MLRPRCAGSIVKQSYHGAGLREVLDYARLRAQRDVQDKCDIIHNLTVRGYQQKFHLLWL